MHSPGAQDDHRLAQQVADGSLAAWHTFVERYTGLLQHTLRHILRDDEEVATVYVAVLERLYRGQIGQYRGDSRLSTWLVLVARSAALDRLRHRQGRRQEPAQLARMDETARELYRMHFDEGLSLEAIRHRLRAEGRPVETLEEELGALLQALSPSRRRRLDYALQARAGAAPSGRALEYHDEQRLENRNRMHAMSPDEILARKEERVELGRLRAALDSLAPEDRHILALRFARGLSARQIAAELGLQSTRRAFTRLSTALRRMRRALETSL
ncbi:sigma-70 family RNA polymerase sigma factor [bacterium]|nr:sigma-70 family RNA polymerase sigma factor [bacterium]